jgi:hypothetical protein
MNLNDLSREEIVRERIEQVQNAKRRDQAFMRSPVTAPPQHLTKDVRRIVAETKEELRLRG